MDDKTHNEIKSKTNPNESTLQSGTGSYYNRMVMEHFTNPRNIGEMTEGETDGFALLGDPSCGDQLKLWIKVQDNKIMDIKFKCFGCPGAIATSSMLTVLAKGKTIEQAKKLTDNDVIRALGGIPEVKKHCSLMGVNALHHAISDYESKILNRKKYLVNINF
jgi:nitrogen fixation NifU-like protein